MSRMLDQERILDSRKRQRFTLPLPAQEPVESPTPEEPAALIAPPQPPAALPVQAATPAPVVQIKPARRRTLLRTTLFILLLELAAIAALKPPMFVPDPVLVRAQLERLPDQLAHVTAQLSAWLQRPAAPTPQIPPLPVRDGGREAMPSDAGDHQAERGTTPAQRPKRPDAPLHSASAKPISRALATNALAPRSTALEDARKVLRLMETALQDAALAVATVHTGLDE